MSQPRTKKRQWRPKPTDNNQLPPKRKRPFITVRIADPRAGDSHRQEATNDQAKESGTKTVETPVKDRFHWSKPKLDETATTISELKINSSSPTASPLLVAVYTKEDDNNKRNVISIGRVQGSVQINKTNTINGDISRDRLAVSRDRLAVSVKT
ncbi:uncharacterized protein [Argopecten irradians]|uniref:uncharacterized protein n=1 Tax=Argopecten irradians TaxID=31199 RepID=UPI003715ED37